MKDFEKYLDGLNRNDDIDTLDASDIVLKFLGPGKKPLVPLVVNAVYLHLLALTLDSFIREDGWNLLKTLSCSDGEKPSYESVNIAPSQFVTCLTSGRLFLQKEDIRLVVQINQEYYRPASLVVCGLDESRPEIEGFVSDIEKTVKDLSLYKQKKLKFTGDLLFIEFPEKRWEELSLSPELKEEIIANTVGFLQRREEWSSYGIPRKRGLILAGAPGTGKTLISKVLLSNSPGITFLAADPARLVDSSYIRNIYSIACDLKPTIVFLEDIDLVGEKRLESHYSRGDALTGLLDVLDGVEEFHDIVTIATTNCPQVLDDALSQRPSRFDRTITMRLPNKKLRREIVAKLARKIPLTPEIQDYLTEKTKGYTPAQINEVVYSMVIQHKHPDLVKQGLYKFRAGEVDGVLRRISRKNGTPLGFSHKGNQTDIMP